MFSVRLSVFEPSAEHLKELTRGQTIRLEVISIDRYGRTITINAAVVIPPPVFHRENS